MKIMFENKNRFVIKIIVTNKVYYFKKIFLSSTDNAIRFSMSENISESCIFYSKKEAKEKVELLNLIKKPLKDVIIYQIFKLKNI
jgi:hypothetical protein